LAQVETLARDGFLMVGVGCADVHTSETQIPAADLNHYGYASTGEAYAAGQAPICQIAQQH
jgi:hypothetical protein